jgi:two-component sensor histidine kinase
MALVFHLVSIRIAWGKLGMQIVFALGEQQLGGNVTFDFEDGFSCKIQFPLSLENFE